MKKLVMVLVMLLLAVPTFADWDPGDFYKMHFPQLPDPLGWDVAWSTNLADDWMCSQSGPVSDIHFWFSVKDDNESIISEVGGVSVVIRKDDRPELSYSRPGDELWSQYFTIDQVAIREYGIGDQGWYDPIEDLVIPNNHQKIYQVNIVDIIQPFIQERGTIYWLDLYVQSVTGAPLPELGWKTSLDHFEDDAVYWDGQAYQELFDPMAQPTFSLDLAFVITPEPMTLTFLAFGGLALLRRSPR